MLVPGRPGSGPSLPQLLTLSLTCASLCALLGPPLLGPPSLTQLCPPPSCPLFFTRDRLGEGEHGALFPAGSVGVFSCVSQFSRGLLKCSAFNLVTVLLTKYWSAISKLGFVPVVESTGANYMPKVTVLPAWSWPGGRGSYVLKFEKQW